MEFREILAQRGEEAGFTFSPEQLRLFTLYYELVISKNKVMNLTAITEPEEFAIKHIIDSLLVYDKKLFAHAKVLDLGTGAGFPGIPLKIFRPELNLTLVDSLAKRLCFLDEVIRVLGLNFVQTKHLRAEEAGRNSLYREKYQLVVARAVAALPALSEYALPLVRIGGSFLAMKGPNYEAELTAATSHIELLGGKVQAVSEFALPASSDKRIIIRIEKVRKTPLAYPRRAGFVKFK